MAPKQFHDVAQGFPQTERSVADSPPADKAFGKFPTPARCEDESVGLGQVSFDKREMLRAADRERFHSTNQYRNDPMALARMKRLDAKTLRGYLERQWRQNAPSKWLKAWYERAVPPALPANATSPLPWNSFEEEDAMKTLLILLLAAALAAGGYLTRPDEKAHEANAETQLSSTRGGFDIGELIADKVFGAGAKDSRKFEDLFVATKYTVKADNTVIMECLGLFAQFLCSQPEKK